MSLSRDNLQKFDVVDAGLEASSITSEANGDTLATAQYEAGGVTIEYSSWNQTGTATFKLEESDDGSTWNDVAVRYGLPQSDDILPDSGADVYTFALDSSSATSGEIKLGYVGDKANFRVTVTPADSGSLDIDRSNAVMSRKSLAEKVVNPVS